MNDDAFRPSGGGGARLCRLSLSHRLVRRTGRAGGAARLAALGLGLYAVALDLLHRLDLLRRRRRGGARRARIPRDLSRSLAGVLRLVVDPAQDGPHRPPSPADLDRRPDLLALRQERDAGGARHHHHAPGHHALHRPAAAIGDALIRGADDRGGGGGRGTRRLCRFPCTLGGGGAGLLHHPVRHPLDRRQRTP